MITGELKNKIDILWDVSFTRCKHSLLHAKLITISDAGMADSRHKINR